jgi:hypothetical protein
MRTGGSLQGDVRIQPLENRLQVRIVLQGAIAAHVQSDVNNIIFRTTRSFAKESLEYRFLEP